MSDNKTITKTQLRSDVSLADEDAINDREYEDANYENEEESHLTSFSHRKANFPHRKTFKSNHPSANNK